MSFTMYKKSYKDVVDDCNDFVYGSSVILSGNAGSVRLMKHKTTTSILYDFDSHTNYSIAVNTYDNLMYSKNPHFGWLKYNFHVLEDLPPQKKQAARDNVGKEVMLNVGGRRKTCTKVEIISAEKATDQNLNIPLSYQQDEVSVENSCVWLATYLVIRSVDAPLAKVLLKQYHDKPRNLNGCICLTDTILILEHYLIISSGLMNDISLYTGSSNHQNTRTLLSHHTFHRKKSD